MTLPVEIEGVNKDAEVVVAGVDNRRGRQPGAIVAFRSLDESLTTVAPLLNSTFGANLNQDVSFGGTPEIIHNGATSTEWTGNIITGDWNLADAGKITLTAGSDNDSVTFAEETPTTIDIANFTALTGKIDLDTYSQVTNDFLIQFDLAGVAVGDALSLNGFIDSGNFNEQSFAIPKADFNFGTTVVDGFTITLTRSGGARPTVKFDDIQLEQTGTPLTFTYRPTGDGMTRLLALKIIMADNVTVPSSYNAFFGDSALPIGITVSATSEGQIVFTGSFTRLADFISVANSTFQDSIGAADSWMSINIPFLSHPVILNGALSDSVEFTINDNLSGLLFFRVFVTVITDL